MLHQRIKTQPPAWIAAPAVGTQQIGKVVQCVQLLQLVGPDVRAVAIDCRAVMAPGSEWVIDPHDCTACSRSIEAQDTQQGPAQPLQQSLSGSSPSPTHWCPGPLGRQPPPRWAGPGAAAGPPGRSSWPAAGAAGRRAEGAGAGNRSASRNGRLAALLEGCSRHRSSLPQPQVRRLLAGQGCMSHSCHADGRHKPACHAHTRCFQNPPAHPRPPRAPWPASHPAPADAADQPCFVRLTPQSVRLYLARQSQRVCFNQSSVSRVNIGAVQPRQPLRLACWRAAHCPRAACVQRGPCSSVSPWQAGAPLPWSSAPGPLCVP